MLRVVAEFAVGVCDRLADLLNDRVRLVDQVDGAKRGRHRLRHLALRMLEIHHPGSEPGHDGLGDDEGLAVTAVEANRKIAGELEMLALVVSYRHFVRVVEEDVGGHEHGIGEQPCAHRLVAFALLLELGHAPKLAEARSALEQPAQACVLVHMALGEDDADLRVEPAREQP